MTFDEYQTAATRTAMYPNEGLLGVYYTALGLTNEAGEVAGKVKKMMRDDDNQMTFARRDAIAAELGDVLWYCSMLASELGISLGSIAETNIDKLAGRAERGTIVGDGDHR